MKTWIGTHFDVIAATWLIVLVFAWSTFMAAMSGSKPSDWSGPLIGGVDWYSAVTQPAASNATQVSTQP